MIYSQKISKLFIQCKLNMKKSFNFIKSLPSRIWKENLTDDGRNQVKNILNYMFTAIPLTFFFYFVIGWIFNKNLNPILLYVCVTIFLIYYEHYYKWHRIDWIEKEE